MTAVQDTEIVDLQSVREAYRAARYAEVLAATARWEAMGTQIGSWLTLRAEALLRRSPADTIAWLATVRDVLDDSDATQMFAFEIAAARAYAGVSNLEAAEARLGSAARYATAVVGGPEKLALQNVRLRFMQRELRSEDSELATACNAAEPQTRLEGLELRAWAFAIDENYAAQRMGLRVALAYALEFFEHVEMRVVANITYTLARLSFETADAEGSADAQRAYDRIEWCDELKPARFQTLRAMGWDAYVRGGAGQAQWLFRDAMACAPSRAWETMARLDRAHVARLSGNEAWAADELENADEIASDVNWSSTVGEERVVLATLAALMAPVDIARAQRYAAAYTALGTSGMDSALAFTSEKDRRTSAFRRYVFGTLERLSGNAETATTALQMAYESFDAAGYIFRAALSAADLYDMTGDAQWASRARAHAAAYPGTPLLGRFQRDERRDTLLDVLSPFARQLARALWESIDDEDRLSERFSRSLQTIRRETPLIFAAFGVTSRGALRAAAAARGLLSVNSHQSKGSS